MSFQTCIQPFVSLSTFQVPIQFQFSKFIPVVHMLTPFLYAGKLSLNRGANTSLLGMSQLAHSAVPHARQPVQETEDSTQSSYTPTIGTRMHSHGRETVSHHQFPASTQLQPTSLTVKARVQQLEGNPSSYTNHNSEEVTHLPETMIHQLSSHQAPTKSVAMQSEPHESSIPQQGGSTRARHLSEDVKTSAPIAPMHFRQTSTPLPSIHRLPSHPLPIHGAENEKATPTSISASSSVHEMYNTHNHVAFDQESHCISSPSSTNVSQDILPEPHGAMGVHHLGHQLLEHNPVSSQLSDMHIGQRGAFAPHQSQPWYHVCNSSQEFLPPSQSLMPDITLRVEASYRPSSTPPSTFHRRTSFPETTLRSTQTERLPLPPHSASFSHSPYQHKKSSAPASIAVSDSGVEHKAGPGSTASESIEPWMSVSNEKEQFERSWMQSPPHATSVSTGVQTECEEGSEKTPTPATLSPVAPICDG